jgi:hypothetical protein
MQDILIKFSTLTDFKHLGPLKSLLDIFEQSKIFRPAKWRGEEGSPKLPYNRDEMIQGIAENGERYIPALYGNKKNPYEMIFFVDSSRSEGPAKHLNVISLRIKYPSTNDSMIEIFEFSSALARICKPEFGVLLFVKVGMHELGWMASVSNDDIQRFGLGGLGIRTTPVKVNFCTIAGF